MAGPLCHAAIVMLARDRLAQIQTRLEAKRGVAGVLNPVERHVLHLATKAHALLSGEPSVEPPQRLYGPPLGQGMSKFAVLGATGPDLFEFANLDTRGAEWLRDAIYRGHPDGHREMVLANTTRFAFDLWTDFQTKVGTDIPDPTESGKALAKGRAYVLGHMCHVATDVVLSPFIDDRTWALPAAAPNKPLDQRAVVDAIEAAVAARLFQSNPRTRGARIADLWPAAAEVPSQLYAAYSSIMPQLYPGLNRAVPFDKGFGEFEAWHAANSPPAPTPALARRGYELQRYKLGLAAWDYGDWLGATFWMFLPALFFPLFGFRSNLKHLFRDQAFLDALRLREGEDAFNEEAAHFEFLVAPFVPMFFLPIVGAGLATAHPLKAGWPTGTAWGSAIVWLALAISYLGFIGNKPKYGDWVWLFVIGLVLSLLHIVATLWDRGVHDPEYLRIVFIAMFHLLQALIFWACYAGFLYKFVESWVDEADDRDKTWLWYLLWVGIVLLLLFVMPLFFQLASVSTPAANAAVTDSPRFVRLFADDVLYAARVLEPPTLTDVSYPSGRRPLLKLWWDGPAPAPEVRSDRDRLIFRFAPGSEQTIFAPLAPTTSEEFAQFLNRVVRDSAGNATQHLRASVALPSDATNGLIYRLPTGPVFADHGDTETDQAAHDVSAQAYRPIGTTEATAYTLYHAAKSVLSTRYGKAGPATAHIDARTAVAATPAGAQISTDPVDTRVVTLTAGALNFAEFFRAGDLLEAPPGGAFRVIEAVLGPTQVRIALPFNAALAGSTFQRAADDRRVDRPGVGSVALTGPDQLTFTGGAYGQFLRPGDTLRVTPPGGTARLVRIASVDTDRVVTVVGDFQSWTGPALYVRASEESADGFSLLGDNNALDDTLFTGETLFNHAADLAALLCMGATSRILPANERAASPAAGDTVLQVYQVFRNWNLSRRRINEWKMLIAGGAVSEKRGDPTAADDALGAVMDHAVAAGAGEPLANQLGWVPLLRKWLDVAQRPAHDTLGSSSFLPGDPSNYAVSRALAYLFDMADPVPNP